MATTKTNYLLWTYIRRFMTEAMNNIDTSISARGRDFESFKQLYQNTQEVLD